MKRVFTKVLAAAALSAAVAGCFDEPEPAYKTVPEGARVYMKDQGLVDLKGQSFDASKIDYLNLDRNALTNVDEVASLVGLKWLRLNGNRLSSLPSLTDIDLSGNPVSEVPEWLAKKEGLQFLSFSRTRITKLPDDLSAWKRLKALQLGDLQMSPDEMARIRKTLPDVAIVF